MRLDQDTNLFKKASDCLFYILKVWLQRVPHIRRFKLLGCITSVDAKILQIAISKKKATEISISVNVAIPCSMIRRMGALLCEVGFHIVKSAVK